MSFDKNVDSANRITEKQLPNSFNWRVFILISLGLIAGSLITSTLKCNPGQPQDANTDSSPKTKGFSETELLALRESAWKKIEPRLQLASQEADSITEKFVRQIEAFFDGRKKGATAFAKAALSWESKWELIKSRTGHQEFIQKQFSQYIFSESEIEKFLKSSVSEYEAEIKSLENRLLVQIRADLQDMPGLSFPSFSNAQLLKSRYEEIIASVIASVAKDLNIEIGKEITSLAIDAVIAVVITKTLTAAATRLGLSGAILGSGAASSWATFGAGLVLAIAVDYVLDWIIGWFHDPIGDITEKVTNSLDEVKNMLVNGDPGAQKAYKLIKEMANNHLNSEFRTRANEVLANIDRSGSLGLRHSLGKVMKLQTNSRQLALRKLIFGEQQK